MHGQIYRCIDMDGWTDRQMDEKTDGQMDGCIDRLYREIEDRQVENRQIDTQVIDGGMDDR